MTKFGDELSGVELDFFSVITDAIKSGIGHKEIEAACRAAFSQAFNKRTPGKRGVGKIKNIERHEAKMLEVLIADPKKKIFTVAKEVLQNVPERGRLTPEHLAKKFKANRKAIRHREILRLLKLILESLDGRSVDDQERTLLQRAQSVLEVLERAWAPDVESAFRAVPRPP